MEMFSGKNTYAIGIGLLVTGFGQVWGIDDESLYPRMGFHLGSSLNS